MVSEDEIVRALELSSSGTASVTVAPGGLMSSLAGLPSDLALLPTAQKSLAMGQKMSPAKAG